MEKNAFLFFNERSVFRSLPGFYSVALASFVFFLEVHAQTIAVTLLPTTNPNFGSQCIQSFSNSTTYEVSGTGLTGDITISAPAGFEIRTGNAAFSTSVILTPVGSIVSTTIIEARFSPATVGYTGVVDINHSSPGAVQVPLSVDGTGIDGGTCNSFFIGPGTVVKVNPAVGSTPTLYVNGDIISKNAIFTNDAGIIELTGSWYNTSSTNAYVSTGTERFIGSSDQKIAGNWSGTSGNQNQFYNLKVSKSSSVGEYISLLDDVHINSSGSLQFEGSHGIIRTQGSSSTIPTGNYTNKLFLQNPSASAISGHSSGNGAITRYIEGKLQRQVNSASTYYFPVGVEKTFLDGMEAFSVTFNTAPASTGLLGYIQPATNPSINTDLIADGDVLFFDVGTFIAPDNNFSQCSGGPDGRDDVAVISQAISHEWIAEAAGTYNYNISVFPGSNLDNLAYSVLGSPCNAIYPKAQYLARNGRIGGDGAVGPTINYYVPGVNGLYQAPTLTTLSNQSAFSRFRLFGAIDNNTSLPVELLSLTATAIENEYIRIDWSTASEYNNRGFFLERGLNGTDFTPIAWVDGNGTSSVRHDYLYNDRDVQKGIRYYYRLRQTDLNGSISFSNTVYARLAPYAGETIVVYPNPATDNVLVQVISEQDAVYTVEAFDVLGRVMHRSQLIVRSGQPSYLSIPSVYWATGTYIIRSGSGGREYQTIKLIKK